MFSFHCYCVPNIKQGDTLDVRAADERLSFNADQPEQALPANGSPLKISGVMEQRAGTEGIFEVQDLRCGKLFQAHPVSVSEPSETDADCEMISSMMGAFKVSVLATHD